MKEEIRNQVEELSDDVLDQVSGAGGILTNKVDPNSVKVLDKTDARIVTKKSSAFLGEHLK